MPYYKNENGEFVPGGEAKRFKVDSPEVGQWICYPHDHNFRTISSIPEEVARLWVEKIGVAFNRYHSATETFDGELPAGFSKYCNNQWLNKLAIIVEVREWTDRVYAVYNHDGKISLLEKEN